MLVYQRVYIHDYLFYFLCLIVSFHDNAASKKGRSVALLYKVSVLVVLLSILELIHRNEMMG